jgi:hypothetical protein
VLDGAHVGVAAAEEDVVQDGLFGASTFDGIVDVVDLEIQLSINESKMGERSRACSGRCESEIGN